MFSLPTDQDYAEAYENWINSPAGAFVLGQTRNLAGQLIAGWPRRGHSLLEIGCGHGFLLESFWEAGLDVTGLDNNPERLEQARIRLGGRADLQLGPLDHIPFDKDAFDYVAVLNPLSYTEKPAAILNEAFGVARKGVIFGFFNKHSLYRFYCLINSCSCNFRVMHWHSCLSMLALVKRATGGLHGSMRSTLFGPPGSWSKNGFWKGPNKTISPVPLGAYVAVRVDLDPALGVTPLYLSTRATVTVE